MDYLKLILDWFNSLNIVVNEDKLKRQLSIITSWFSYNGIGVLEAVTGFGKTYVAIIAIYRLNLKLPDINTIIIVPTIKLHKDWLDHIEFFRLKKCEVFVVNTYTARFLETKIRYTCGLLVCDEVHNYLGEKAEQFNQTIKCTDWKMFLGLSATLDEKEKTILAGMNIPIVDTVTMSEAQRFQYISNYDVYNLAIPLNSEDRAIYDRINDIHNSTYSKFIYFTEGEKNFALIRACKSANESNWQIGNDWKTAREWKEWYAEKMNWDGDPEHIYSPKNLAKYANQWYHAMTQRKDILQKHSSKVIAATNIYKYLQVPTITFSENTSFADELANMIGSEAMVYHSNIVAGYEKVPTVSRRKTLVSARKLCREVDGKLQWIEDYKGYEISYNKEVKVSAVRLRKIAINKFESGEIKVLVTAKALDEGFNVEGIGCAIICSGSSRKRQYIQRMGRSLRFIEGKTAKIINLYIPDTQDEKWLKSRQRGDPGIHWITEIKEII